MKTNRNRKKKTKRIKTMERLNDVKKELEKKKDDESQR